MTLWSSDISPPSSVLHITMFSPLRVLLYNLLGVHANAIHIDGQEYLLLHRLQTAVPGQSKVEEARVTRRQHVVLILLFATHRLDHESDIFLDEGLIVGG